MVAKVGTLLELAQPNKITPVNNLGTASPVSVHCHAAVTLQLRSIFRQ